MARGAPSSWTAAAVRSLLRRVSELEEKVNAKKKEESSFQWNVCAQDFTPAADLLPAAVCSADWGCSKCWQASEGEDIVIGECAPPDLEPLRPEGDEKLEALSARSVDIPCEFKEEEEVKREKAPALPLEEKKSRVSFAPAKDELQAGGGDEPAQFPEVKPSEVDSDTDESASEPASPQPVDSPRAAAAWARAHRQLAHLPWSSGSSVRSVQAEVGPGFHVWLQTQFGSPVAFDIALLGGNSVVAHGCEDAEGDCAACAEAPPECLSVVTAFRKRIDTLLLVLEESPEMFSDFGTAVRLTRSSHDWLNSHSDPDPEDVKKRIVILDRLVSCLKPGAAPLA